MLYGAMGAQLGETGKEDRNSNDGMAGETAAKTRIIGSVALPAWRFSDKGAFMDRALMDAGAITAPFNTSVAVLQRTGGTGLELAMRRNPQSPEMRPSDWL
jgi:hypothetical protein